MGEGQDGGELPPNSVLPHKGRGGWFCLFPSNDSGVELKDPAPSRRREGPYRRLPAGALVTRSATAGLTTFALTTRIVTVIASTMIEMN